MHSLYKEPHLKALTTRLLRRIEIPGKCQAGSALRSYCAFSLVDTPGYPGLSTGRIQIPRGLILEGNNGHTESAPLPAAILAFESEIDNDCDSWIEVFSDRSCLLFQPETDPDCAPSFEMMRVFPVCLRLASKVKISEIGEVYRLAVRTEKSYSWLAAISDDDEKKEFNLGRDPMPRLARETICHQLSEESRAWIRMINKMPFLADPKTGPLSGVLGIDIPAPRQDLHGTEYAWPAALPYYGFTKEYAVACSRYIELAWIYLLETDLRDINDARIEVFSCEPKQSGGVTCLTVNIEIIPTKGRGRKSVETAANKSFRALLAQPSAPEGIEKFTATATLAIKGKATRTGLKGLLIYGHHLSQDGPPSAHNRLRALHNFKAATINLK